MKIHVFQIRALRRIKLYNITGSNPAENLTTPEYKASAMLDYQGVLTGIMIEAAAPGFATTYGDLVFDLGGGQSVTGKVFIETIDAQYNYSDKGAPQAVTCRFRYTGAVTVAT